VGVSKLIFIDVETTGRVAADASIWSLSYIIDIDGVEKERGTLKMCPTTEFEDRALEIANESHTLEEILGFPKQEDQFIKFKVILNRYINQFDTKDKFLFAGYNSKFDEEFVRDWFTKNKDTYYGSWFYNGTLDIMALCAYTLQSHRHKLPNFQLGTIAKLFQIDIEAHQSESDVNATYEIYKDLSTNVIPIKL